MEFRIRKEIRDQIIARENYRKRCKMADGIGINERTLKEKVEQDSEDLTRDAWIFMIKKYFPNQEPYLVETETV